MDLGNILFFISLLLSAIILIFHAWSVTGNKFAITTSQRLFYLTTITISFSVLLLLAAFLNHRFEYVYVYSNSSRDMSTVYLIAAFWAGKEGSFLLWLFILNIIGIVIIKSKDENENILMSVITVTQIFILLMLVIESPFQYLWEKYADISKDTVPLDGAGLKPLLMDPWMIAHPPILFIGYAATTVPFGYAIAALLKNDYKTWLSRSYKWILFCMVTLGIGIFLGGYWAYKVLGWGGFWGWDPVENSSLIPWLVILALMHGFIIQKRKEILVKTNIILSLLSFILVFYSTFLTRSGVLSNFSVHSFSDSKISLYLILFILFYFFISIFLFIKNFNKIESKPLDVKFWSWENLLVLGIITLLSYTLIILIGTSMPIITSLPEMIYTLSTYIGKINIYLYKLLELHPTSVSTNYYYYASIPLGIIILLFMIFSTAGISKKLLSTRNIIITTLSIILGILFNIMHTINPFVYIITTLSLYLIAQNSIDIYMLKSSAILSSRLGHIGVAIMVMGIISSTFHSTTEQKKMYAGKEESINSVNVTFKGLKESEKTSLIFSIRNGDKITEIESAYYFKYKFKSLYFEASYKEPCIQSNFLYDIYITPDNYESGLASITALILKKGEEKRLGNLNIKFVDFNTEGMTTSEPAIVANLLINGQNISPRVIMKDEDQIRGDALYNNRTISLIEIDANNKLIMLYISPEKDAAIPPDSIFIAVTKKRFIWLVWLGTVLISISGIMALIKSR